MDIEKATVIANKAIRFYEDTQPFQIPFRNILVDVLIVSGDNVRFEPSMLWAGINSNIVIDAMAKIPRCANDDQLNDDDIDKCYFTVFHKYKLLTIRRMMRYNEVLHYCAYMPAATWVEFQPL